ncbi:DUF4214 domain-containing protein [Duganella sp. BuS-21]|uniref:DUF4214 domain-containing protein n=1 Tax=Duganella sp. BuS-21 TaxID=2943848 RepID=UPI0035A5AB8E
MPDDDYSDNSSTTGELVIGDAINGKLDYSYDQDMIKVWLQAGVSYAFSLADSNPYINVAGNMGLLLSDANALLAQAEGFDLRAGPAFEFTPATSGQYYLSVHFWYGATGGYTLSGAIKPPDPIASNIHTTGVLTVGEALRGEFEVAGDSDWYKIHVEAGQHYGFNLPKDGATTSVTGFQLYDASGKALDSTILEPATAGDYFVAVSGYAPGVYNLKATLLNDDYSQNQASPGVLRPGDSISGEIQYAADSDRFIIEVEAGKIYTLQLTGSAIDLRTLECELYDEAGKVIDRLGEQYYNGDPRTFGFTAAASGTYSVLVNSSNASLTLHRAYTLSASAGVVDDFGNTPDKATAVALGATIHGVNTYKGDADVVKLLLLAGTTYALQLRPDAGETQLLSSLNLSGADGVKLGNINGGGSEYTYTPSTTGYYYASISANGAAHYQLTPVEAVDDWGANSAKAGRLALGASVTGTLETGGGDRDWFALEMGAGDTYAIALQKAPTDTAPASGYLEQTIKLNILNAQGQVLSTVTSSTGGSASLLAYTAEQAGTYYVEIASTYGYPTNFKYQLSASGVPRDLVGDTAADAALLADSVPAKGVLEVSSDADMYQVSVTAGHTYAIQFSASALQAGQWPDVNLTASDSGGTVYLRRVSGNSGTSGGESLLYTASKDGELYLKVNERYGNPAVGYQLSATSLGADDYVGNRNTTAVLPIGGALRGMLGYADDIDMVKLTLTAGQSYQFDLLDKGDGQGTLPGNSAGLKLYAANGAQIYDGLGRSGTTLGYTATESGDYYLAVGAPSASIYAIGSYALQATTISSAPQLQGSASSAPGLHLVSDNIVLDFNQQVRVVNDSGIKLFDASGQQLGVGWFSSDNPLTAHLSINPSFTLAPGETYKLNIAAGAIVDAAGHQFAGLQGYTFTTAPVAAAATDGADLLVGAHNGATLHGGAGIDTVLYKEDDFFFRILRNGSQTEVKFPFGPTPGTDLLDGVERLLFRDSAYALDIDGNGGQAYRLYQAAFNRTPDSAGLGYWINAMDHGVSLHQAAKDFIASTEFSNRYGSAPNDDAFLTLLYNNVLHRDPDAAGKDYWLGAMHDGVSRAGVLASFSESAENQAALIGKIGNGFEYTVYGG